MRLDEGGYVDVRAARQRGVPRGEPGPGTASNRPEKHTAVLNAANEQAVHAFLEHRLPYLGIVDTVREVLDEMDAELRGNPLFASVEEMSRLEQEARARADKLINK